MLSFKQFFIESPHLNEIPRKLFSADDTSGKNRKKITVGKWEQDNQSDDPQHKLISSTPTHDIYVKHEKNETTFTAVNKSDRKAHVYVDGQFINKKPKRFLVNILGGTTDSTFKAHDFYHHLLHAGHIHELISDQSQSRGAKKVWHKLSKLPGVELSKGNFGEDGHAKFSNKLKDIKPVKHVSRHFSNKYYHPNFHNRFIAKVKV